MELLDSKRTQKRKRVEPQEKEREKEKESDFCCRNTMSFASLVFLCIKVTMVIVAFTYGSIAINHANSEIKIRVKEGTVNA